MPSAAPGSPPGQTLTSDAQAGSAAPTSEEEANAQSGSVHEFLVRVVTDPQARAAFAADPAATAAAAGFGDLYSAQLGDACSFALDYAPADVVDVYRSSLHAALAHVDGPIRGTAINAAHHATEIADMPGQAFGHHGDVDKFMAKDSFNLVNVHDVASNNTISGQGAELPNPAQGAGAVTGALSQGTEQVHDVASGLPAVGPAASHVVPEHLPTPEQLPATVSHVAAQGPEQLHAAAESLPVVGNVADQLPSPDAATSHLSALPAHAPAALNAPVENVAGNLPVVGDVAGHLPL